MTTSRDAGDDLLRILDDLDQLITTLDSRWDKVVRRINETA